MLFLVVGLKPAPDGIASAAARTPVSKFVDTGII